MAVNSDKQPKWEFHKIRNPSVVFVVIFAYFFNLMILKNYASVLFLVRAF